MKNPFLILFPGFIHVNSHLFAAKRSFDFSPCLSITNVKFLLFLRKFSCADSPLLFLCTLRVSLCPLWFKRLLSAFISENQRQKGFDFLRVSVSPWWLLVFGCGLATLYLRGGF